MLVKTEERERISHTSCNHRLGDGKTSLGDILRKVSVSLAHWTVITLSLKIGIWDSFKSFSHCL